MSDAVIWSDSQRLLVHNHRYRPPLRRLIGGEQRKKCERNSRNKARKSRMREIQEMEQNLVEG